MLLAGKNAVISGGISATAMANSIKGWL